MDEREELKELILAMTEDQFAFFIKSVLPVLQEAAWREQCHQEEAI